MAHPPLLFEAFGPALPPVPAAVAPPEPADVVPPVPAGVVPPVPAEGVPPVPADVVPPVPPEVVPPVPVAPPVPPGGWVKVQKTTTQVAPCAWHLQSESWLHQPSSPTFPVPAGLQVGVPE